MEKIAITMSAYNAEKTIREAIESVLCQTYRDFVFFVADNGSNDSTWKIICEYMQKDDRIIAVKRKENYTGSYISVIYGLADSENINEQLSNSKNYLEYFRDIRVADWICVIDSDDTMQPTFIEDMFNFVKSNNLDIAACGWDFVRPDNVENRIPGEDLIYETKQYTDNLPVYDKFMGPTWNKMFSRKVLAKHVNYFENKFAKLHSEGVFFYGADTCFNYIVLSKAERFGVLNKSLYNYNIHNSSVTRKNFHPMRIVADRRLAQCRFDFLNELGNGISEENRKFIFNIYYKSTMTTLRLLADSDNDIEYKVKHFSEMFNCALMKEAMKDVTVKKSPLFY
ncbi:MAG: glycosyltransferase [Oscillospiraceae bacterium]|nr:glycosyltransferase [Oscillospiraceae bacterium]